MPTFFFHLPLPSFPHITPLLHSKQPSELCAHRNLAFPPDIVPALSSSVTAVLAEVSILLSDGPESNAEADVEDAQVAVAALGAGGPGDGPRGGGLADDLVDARGACVGDCALNRALEAKQNGLVNVLMGRQRGIS